MSIQQESYWYSNTEKGKEFNQPFDNIVSKSQYSTDFFAYYQHAEKAQSKIIKREVIEQSLEVTVLQHSALLLVLSKNRLLLLSLWDGGQVEMVIFDVF